MDKDQQKQLLDQFGALQTLAAVAGVPVTFTRNKLDRTADRIVIDVPTSLYSKLVPKDGGTLPRFMR